MQYAIVWEFEVAAEMRPQFLRAYGPDGEWASLFRRSPGYVGTLLLADQAQPTRFLTIDRWGSDDDYRQFLERFRADYDEIDRRCERLTCRETKLGSYWEHIAAAG